MTLCVQFEPLKIQCIECIGDEVVVRLLEFSSAHRFSRDPAFSEFSHLCKCFLLIP